MAHHDLMNWKVASPVLKSSGMDPVLKPKSMRRTAYQSLVRLYPFQEGHVYTNEARIQSVLRGFTDKLHTTEGYSSSNQSMLNRGSTFMTSPGEYDKIWMDSLVNIWQTSSNKNYPKFPTTTHKLKTSRQQLSSKKPTNHDPSLMTVRLPTLISSRPWNITGQDMETSSPRNKSVRFPQNTPQSSYSSFPEAVDTHSFDQNNNFGTNTRQQGIYFLKFNSSISPTKSVALKQFHHIPGYSRKPQYVFDQGHSDSKWDVHLPAAPNTPDSLIAVKPKLIKFSDTK